MIQAHSRTELAAWGLLARLALALLTPVARVVDILAPALRPLRTRPVTFDRKDT